MKIALIYSDSNFSSVLTQFFTGTRDYHICFVDDDLKTMWDQHWLFRQIPWHYENEGSKHYDLFECPFPITAEELDQEVMQDVRDFCDEHKHWINVLYGWRDYSMFALRPIYHALGKSTPNFGGTVCSGRVRDIGARRGWTELGSVFDAEPSPADWRRFFQQNPQCAVPS